MNPLALQGRPEERVLHAVICLSKVHEGCKKRLLLESGPDDEVAQSKQLMLCGHARPEACLARSTQASFFSLADNAAVQDGSIQPAKRLPHCNWPNVCRITPIPFLEGVTREDFTSAGRTPR